MSDIELRPITKDEVPAFARTFGVSFGWDADDESDLEFWRWVQGLGRTLAAFDDGRIVATAGIIPFQLTLPGGKQAPAGGVTAISVLPTHRRRGILREIMRRQMEDMRERGEAAGILWASESVIYGRFGYGLATSQADLKIKRPHTAFGRAPAASGSVRLLEKDEAAALLPEIYDRFRRRVPGQVDRVSGWWDDFFRDNPQHRRGGSKRYYAVYQHGDDEGYAAYRLKSEWPGGIPGSVAQVADLVSTGSAAYTALWRYLLDLDLVDTVSIHGRPLEEPLRWMLADPRRLRFEDVGDAIWLRVVDIPRALEARRYMVDGTLRLRITDPFCPDNDGTYRLEGGSDRAACARTDEDADLALDVADLGAAFLGGTPLSVLATAGRVEELCPGSLRLADAMFASDIAPWCDHHF
jgi:predicted acetyltransferase